MFTPLEAFIGWRYTRARRRTRFVSLVSAIAIGGVTLGVTALITILSIMNGFERELRERLLGMSAHLTVQVADAALEPVALDHLRRAPHVTGVAPYITAEALLGHAGQVQGARFFGIDPAQETQVSSLAAHLVEGRLDALTPGSFGVVLGRGLAATLQVRVGDRVTLVLPEPMRTAAGILPRLKQCTVVGLFEAGVQEFDEATGFLALTDASRIFRTGGRPSGWRARLDDPFLAPEVAASLIAAVPAAHLEDWTHTHSSLFRALRTEKIVMFIIMLLAVAVAAFNLVSTLVMVVGEKQTEIAILATLGLTPLRLLKIFLAQGGYIGLAGVAIGGTLGLLLASHIETLVAALESAFGFHVLSPEVYYISRIPSEVRPLDVTLALLAATLLCLLAPIYPAWQASRVQPAVALRHE